MALKSCTPPRASGADPKLHKAVAFLLTTSRDERDKAAAYEYNVAGYIMKETVGTDFIDLIGTLDHYWRIVELPNMTLQIDS